MKIFSFILSLILLGVSLFPCDDNVESRACNEAMAAVHYDVQEDDNHAEKHDCSPLCGCQCCHIHVTFNDKTISFDFIEYPCPASVYIKTFPSGFAASIWQPPILS